MAMMRTLERRYFEGLGERHLATDPTKIRCQGVSKTKLRLIRADEKNPDLTPDDVWPRAQCSRGALPGAYGCKLHAGTSAEAKYRMEDFMPIDLAEKVTIFKANSAEILNRTNEIALLKARNAELLESTDDLILGEEAWMAVQEAIDRLNGGEVASALVILKSAVGSFRKEKEVWAEVRANNTLIDTLTKTHFAIAEKLRLFVTLDQVRHLMDGMFKGTEIILADNVDDESSRIVILREFADMLRKLTTLREGALLVDGTKRD